MNTIFRLVNFHQKNYFKLVETSYEMIQVAQFRNNEGPDFLELWFGSCG